MTITILNRLTEEVMARMPTVTRPLARLGSISVWARPPLMSGLRLGNVEIDDVYPLQSRLGAYELADIYEEFIEGYFIGDELRHRRPFDWIRKNLGLSGIEAKRVAPVNINTGKRPHNEDWLAIILWVIHKAIKGSELTLIDTTMLVKLEDKTIGVAAGVLMSEYNPWKTLDYVPDFREILTQPVLGTRGACRHSGLNKYYMTAGQQPEGPALQLALRALYWRVADADRLESRLFGGEVKMRGKRLIDDIRKGLLTATDPLKFLHEQLVPRYTTTAEFRACFGNLSKTRIKVKPRTLEHWLLSIESTITMVDGE